MTLNRFYTLDGQGSDRPVPLQKDYKATNNNIITLGNTNSLSLHQLSEFVMTNSPGISETRLSPKVHCTVCARFLRVMDIIIIALARGKVLLPFSRSLYSWYKSSWRVSCMVSLGYGGIKDNVIHK